MMRVLLLLAVTIVLAVSPIFPQATTANVVGTITDRRAVSSLQPQ